MTNYADVTLLSCDAIGLKPRSYAFDPRAYSDDEEQVSSWEYWEATACETCGELYVNASGDTCSESCLGRKDCDGHVPVSEGPMMNYFLPLPSGKPINEDAMAKAVARLPVCLVRVGEEYGLALTGGGMDLSWEICEAYMCLGFLPPLHYARDLPRMADRYDAARLARCGWILEGAARSAEIAESWAKQARDSVASTRQWIRAQAKKRA